MRSSLALAAALLISLITTPAAVASSDDLILLTEGQILAPLPAGPAAAASALALCDPDEETLCLLDGRLRVRAEWRNQHDGGTEGTGQAVRVTDKTGFFWFFAEDNLEVVVKVLDGSTVNGNLWVFLGALSDVEFRVHVTDVTSGESRTYFNPPGNRFGIADIRALPGTARCGTIAGLVCAEGFFCEFTEGCEVIPDASGICVERPEGCTAEFDPVCGCDGVTYSNDCLRRAAGVTKDMDGPCPEG